MSIPQLGYALENPIRDRKLQLAGNSDLTSFKILNAAVTAFDDSWAVEKELGGSTLNNKKYLIENTNETHMI